MEPDEIVSPAEDIVKTAEEFTRRPELKALSRLLMYCVGVAVELIGSADCANSSMLVQK